MILKQPYISRSSSQSNQSASPIEKELDDIQKSSLMAGEADKIVKEMNVADLGHFTAYSNQAIKVVFQDRTIVRMMKDCHIIRVLNRRGDELLFNILHPN